MQHSPPAILRRSPAVTLASAGGLGHSGAVDHAEHRTRPSQHLVVMGVSGSGKTTLAELLSERLGWVCAEADDLHPQANVDKMTGGLALTDEDRWPWLRIIRDWLSEQTRAGRSAVVTCSALRAAYRDVLREAEGDLQFVHLTAPADVLKERVEQRVGHFMPPTLLRSQLETLEPLRDDEPGLTVVVDVPPTEVADRVISGLGLLPDATSAQGAGRSSTGQPGSPPPAPGPADG